MKKLTLAAVSAMLALAACDQIPFLQGDRDQANAASTNAAGGNAAAAADAGITSSRSLAGLGGNQAGQGGKDPGAVPAGAQGQADPRLVGRWTDNGDCKQSAELRPDGSFVAPNGATGGWSVTGDELTFTGANGEFRLHLDEVGPDRIVSTNQEGQRGISTRC